MPVFQFLDQNIQWKFVPQCGKRSIKRRGGVKTVAASHTIQAGQGAAWTVRVLVPGQADVARRAEHFISAGNAAQQAPMGQNGLLDICAAVQNEWSII